MTNDTFANATTITVPTNGATVTMAPVVNTGFTSDTIAANPAVVYRDAWWVYQPGSFGHLLIDVSASTPNGGTGVTVELYTGTTLADLSPAGSNGVYDDTSAANYANYVTAGKLWIRIGLADDVDATYRLSVTGQRSAGNGTAITAGCTVDIQATGYADFAPPGTFTGTSTFAVAASGTASYAPRSLAHGYGHAHRASLVVAVVVAQRPVDNAIVPGLQPYFAVDVQSYHTGLTVAVEYDTGPTFATATRVTTPLQLGNLTTHAQVRVANPLSDTVTYYWRARVQNAYDATDWTATQAFTVSSLDGDGVIGARWNCVGNTTPLPHLWFVYPPRAAPGSTVVAYGTGFGPHQATAAVGVQSAPVTSFTTVPADPVAYTPTRAIIAGTGLADPYHQTVTFTVPAVDPPGGVVYIDGS